MATCPLKCLTLCAARGSPQLTWGFDDRPEAERFCHGYLTQWFSADGFTCRVCGLRLDSATELAEAGIDPRMNGETATFEIDKEQEAARHEDAFIRGIELAPIH